jgi:hypothetical protein
MPLNVDDDIGQILQDIDDLLNTALGGGVVSGVETIDPGAYQQIQNPPNPPPGLPDASVLKKKVRDGFRLAFAALLQRLLDGGELTVGGSGGSASFDGTCTASEVVGDVVYVAGPDKDVRKADITDVTGAKVTGVGVIVSKPTATTCKVQTAGLITAYASLTPNARYFIGADSRPTTTRPTGSEGAPKMVVSLGVAIDVGVFLLRPTTVVRALS